MVIPIGRGVKSGIRLHYYEVYGVEFAQVGPGEDLADLYEEGFGATWRGRLVARKAAAPGGVPDTARS